MKWFSLFFLLTISLLPAQTKANKADFQQAVRAYNGGDLETARTLLESVVANDPKNQAAQNYLRMIQAQQKDRSSLSANLKKIILPKVQFQETTAREAVTFVAQQVSKQTNGKQTVNVVWMVPSDQEKTVTLSLENIPAFEVLRYIADASDLELTYDNYAVKVKPAAAPTVSTAQ
jgi:hypothetical protein